MKLLFIYRLYPGENAKVRPPYYSKELALNSFIEAYKRICCEKKLIITVDAADLPNNFKVIAGDYPESIIYFGGLGVVKSYLRVMDILESDGTTDLFYMSEDDYLYKQDAFVAFIDAMNNINSADYVTLYDHPDRYTRSDNQSPFGGEKIFVSGNCHWRTVESTCSTFGGRIASMKNDIQIHRMFGKRQFDDRKIWYKKLGLGRFLWRFPKRHLIGPMPSLCTHMEEAYLAPTIDWALIANQVCSK